MEKKLTARVSARIPAGRDKVWDALTNPDKIKQYFFGTQAVSDWKKGSPIRFKGEWEGRKYEDKGIILETEPGRLFKYSYWSSMGKLEDRPENYAIVSYELEPSGTETVLTISQDHIANEEGRQHSESNWKLVLDGLKKMIEAEKVY